MAPQTGRPIFKLLRLSQYPILEQLRLEQALLRVDRGSWLLINDGTPDPAIVMGVSGCTLIEHSSNAPAPDVTLCPAAPNFDCSTRNYNFNLHLILQHLFLAEIQVL